jgi:nicotinate-nucleotide--dimethylbenzimidazole phosphoribosyltransferase
MNSVAAWTSETKSGTSPLIADFAAAQSERLLDEPNPKPRLDLNMRLGEASGAATAFLRLRAALACHTGMATFAQAGVSDKPADDSAEPKAAG